MITTINEFRELNENKASKQHIIKKLVKAGYSESTAEDFADEYIQGGVKLPKKVKDIIEGHKINENDSYDYSVHGDFIKFDPNLKYDGSDEDKVVIQQGATMLGIKLEDAYWMFNTDDKDDDLVDVTNDLLVRNDEYNSEELSLEIFNKVLNVNNKKYPLNSHFVILSANGVYYLIADQDLSYVEDQSGERSELTSGYTNDEANNPNSKDNQERRRQEFGESKNNLTFISTINEFAKTLQPSITFEQLITEVTNILGDKFKLSTNQHFNPENFGLTYAFAWAYSNVEQKYFTFTECTTDHTVQIHLEYKNIRAGRSLADPRARYQTTSAHTTKTERKKIQKQVNNSSIALTTFQKFIEKYNLV